MPNLPTISNFADSRARSFASAIGSFSTQFDDIIQVTRHTQLERSICSGMKNHTTTK